MRTDERGGGEEVESVTGAESQLLGQLDISSTQLFTSAWPALAKPTSLCCRQNLCLLIPSNTLSKDCAVVKIRNNMY